MAAMMNHVHTAARRGSSTSCRRSLESLWPPVKRSTKFGVKLKLLVGWLDYFVGITNSTSKTVLEVGYRNLYGNGLQLKINGLGKGIQFPYNAFLSETL